MNEIVKNDILKVLSELIKSIKEKNYIEIKELSNHTIHNASIFQDQDSISIAVVIYAISKILERGKGDFNVLNNIKELIKALESSNFQIFKKTMKEILKNISSVDSKLGLYIEEVVNQAEIKKGCKLCEHGISVARASELLGVSQWEMMNYLGKTTIADEHGEAIDVIERLKLARKVFE